MTAAEYQQAVDNRFIQFFEALPAYGDAGQGWDIYLYEKKNNGGYKLYPTHRYQIGVGRSAKIYTDPLGNQIVIAPFVFIDKPEVYLIYPGETPAGGMVYPQNVTGSNAVVQTLTHGKIYYFYRFTDENYSDYWKLLTQKNDLMIEAGYGGVPPSINNQFGRPTDMELSINPNVLNQIENETLQQSKALFSITTLKLLIGITAAAAFTGLMYFLFKPKQQ